MGENILKYGLIARVWLVTAAWIFFVLAALEFVTILASVGWSQPALVRPLVWTAGIGMGLAAAGALASVYPFRGKYLLLAVLAFAANGVPWFFGMLVTGLGHMH